MSLKIFEQRAVGPLACNCYIVGDDATREAIVIDPGGDAEDLSVSIVDLDLRVVAIVATHAHFDHVLAAERLRSLTGAPFYLHPQDRPVLDWFRDSGRLLLGVDLGDPPEVDSDANEGDRLVAGTTELQVLHTPGHSPGSIALLADDALFAGDTLFAGSVGRTDLPGGDTRALVTSVNERFFTLDENLPVFPGHGPATRIGVELETNPFVGRAAQ